MALSGGGASPLEEARLNRQREPLPTDVASLPALPSEYHQALEGALVALKLDLPEAARLAIEGHVRLLLAWNRSINLTAITDPAEIARRHVADSLAALAAIRDAGAATLLDIGSGGGFPGLPLASSLPHVRTTLAESVGKKAAFLSAAVDAIGLAGRVAVAARRAEALAPGRWDVVTARAVGALGDLIELALPVLAVGGRLVAWKRGDLAEELAAGARAAIALGGGPPATVPLPDGLGLPGHVLVVVPKLRPTPPGFPRDPAARRRRPW